MIALLYSLIHNDSSTRQLIKSIKDSLAGLGPGDRLPSTRTLVASHQVSPVTVTRALAALTQEGLVVSRPGAGTFVAQPPPRRQPTDHSWQTQALSERTIDAGGLSPLSDPPHDDQLISLATGYLHSSLMPVRALSAALSHAARLPNAWDRPPAQGLEGLRTWFARAASPDVDARDVLITPGGQAALSAAFRAVVRPGDALLVESPTYPGALALARAAGIRVVPVPLDGDGVPPDRLREALARTGAKAFYAQPTFHNPTGTVLAADRRAALLAAAVDAGAFVIEDDFARWLGHGRAAPPSPLLRDDRDGRVIFITSLTKVASPSLRVGAVIARGPIAERLQAIRVVDDMFVPRPTQEAALELVTRPAWDRHLRQLAESLARRAGTLARALTLHLPAVDFTPPDGGMHIWARLPGGTDEIEVTAAARRAGVVVMPGRPFFAAEAPDPYLRITHSAARSEADLEIAVRRLAGLAEIGR